MFPNIVHEVESALQNAEISGDEKDEMKYVVSLARKRIEAWKAHLLRSINQDEARLDVLKNLDAYSVLLVLDWAMKFLPRKYRESQTNWFGKRGISWHITTATRIVEGQPQMLSFVHVFLSCNQDSFTVLAIIDDVLKQVKNVMPNVNRVYFRQDNAGCYHSASTLLVIPQLAKKYGINVRLDFSDPQGGKGSCDRKAAAVKNHMRIYLNSGRDVETPGQMKNTIVSSRVVCQLYKRRTKFSDWSENKSCQVAKKKIHFVLCLHYLVLWKLQNLETGKFSDCVQNVGSNPKTFARREKT